MLWKEFFKILRDCTITVSIFVLCCWKWMWLTFFEVAWSRLCLRAGILRGKIQCHHCNIFRQDWVWLSFRKWSNLGGSVLIWGRLRDAYRFRYSRLSSLAKTGKRAQFSLGSGITHYRGSKQLVLNDEEDKEWGDESKISYRHVLRSWSGFQEFESRVDQGAVGRGLSHWGGNQGPRLQALEGNYLS